MSLRHYYWYVMGLQYHSLRPDNVCDILHVNLRVFLAGIFLHCDFFVELQRKKSQQTLLVIGIVLFCDLRLASAEAAKRRKSVEINQPRKPLVTQEQDRAVNRKEE